MEDANIFDIDVALADWQKNNLKDNGLTPDDEMEMLDHFCLSVEELSGKGLTQEEAFAVSKVRFGGSEYWAESMKELNEEDYVAKKALNLFYGVILYFIFYKSLSIFIDFLWISAGYIHSKNYESIFNYVFRYRSPVYYYVILPAFISTFFFRKRIAAFIQTLRYKNSKMFRAFFIFINLVILKYFLSTYIIPSLLYSEDINVFYSYEVYMNQYKDWMAIIVAFCFLVLFVLFRRTKYI